MLLELFFTAGPIDTTSRMQCGGRSCSRCPRVARQNGYDGLASFEPFVGFRVEQQESENRLAPGISGNAAAAAVVIVIAAAS